VSIYGWDIAIEICLNGKSRNNQFFPEIIPEKLIEVSYRLNIAQISHVAFLILRSTVFAFRRIEMIAGRLARVSQIPLLVHVKAVLTIRETGQSAGYLYWGIYDTRIRPPTFTVFRCENRIVPILRCGFFAS
jgi:hypothetical protein